MPSGFELLESKKLAAPFEEHSVSPNPIQLRYSFADANFSKAVLLVQSEAADIFRENTRLQSPYAVVL